MKETIIPKIEVKKQSIALLQANAIVNPANSFGFMGGGVAGAIKKIGGQSIEDEAIEKAPVMVGDAIMTSAGDLICQKVIHAPTVHNPGEKTDHHKIACAVAAALELADDEGFKTLGMPAMGTGVGGVDKLEAAEVILKTIKDTKFYSIEKIFLVAIDDDTVEAFKEALANFSKGKKVKSENKKKAK